MHLMLRSKALFIVLLLALASILVASHLRLSQQFVQKDEFNHMPKERYLLLSALEQSLAIQGHGKAPEVCQSMVNVSGSVSKLLQDAMHNQAIRIDPAILSDKIVTAWGKETPPTCEQAAKKIRVLVNARHLHSLVTKRGEIHYLQTVTQQALVTRNPWWGIPGGVSTQDGRALSFTKGNSKTQSFSEMFGTPHGYIGQDLSTFLQSKLASLASSPSGAFEHQFGRDWPVGKSAQLTLLPALQRGVTHDANCDVGSNGEGCSPQARLRAGLNGFVVIDAETSAVLAIGGAASDCINAQLHKLPVFETDKDGKQFLPVFADNTTACPQFPNALSPQFLPKKDKQGDLDLLPMPAVSIPFLKGTIGSGKKPFVVAAGIRAGKVSHLNASYWRCTLSKSRDCGSDINDAHNQQSMQRLAIASASQWQDVLVDAGLLHEPADRAIPTDKQEIYDNVAVQKVDAVTGGLLSSSEVLTELSFPQIRKGILPEERYFDSSEKDRMQKSYLRSAALANAAIGSADVKSSVFGLAQAWTILAQNSLGNQRFPALHIATVQGQATPVVEHKVLGTENTQLLLSLLNQAHIDGTTSSACQKTFGSKKKCAELKVFSKTGSADFSTCRVKGQRPCEQYEIKVDLKRPHFDALPIKWFGSYFTTSAGKRYVVATMALRTRAADGKLDTSNAAAELGMKILRRLEETPLAVRVGTSLPKLAAR